MKNAENQKENEIYMENIRLSKENIILKQELSKSLTEEKSDQNKELLKLLYKLQRSEKKLTMLDGEDENKLKQK